MNRYKDMLALINKIDATNTAADLAGEHSVGSTYALKTSMTKLGKMSHSLDKINRNKYENNPAKLDAWLMASHLQRAPQAVSKNNPTPTP